VAVTLLAEVLKYAILRGLRAVHLSTGTRTRYDRAEQANVSEMRPWARVPAYAARRVAG
jgi:hypothetical protein